MSDTCVNGDDDDDDDDDGDDSGGADGRATLTMMGGKWRKIDRKQRDNGRGSPVFRRRAPARP